MVDPIILIVGAAFLMLTTAVFYVAQTFDYPVD